MTTIFEGSYLGDAGKLAADTRLECGVCWYVYEPSEGDPVYQVDPGTPFADLPEHWHCPNCDSAKERFMVVSSNE